MVAAGGDYARAATIAGGAWEHLAKGELATALREARGATNEPQTMGMAFVEAEALVQAGAVVAGLERLAELHGGAFAAATVALARHCHRFGDHARVVTLAKTMPGHAELALLGARAAIARQHAPEAQALLEPWLNGVLPVPGALQAGAFASVAASLLARRHDHDRLMRVARTLLGAADAPDEMTPAIARIAWSAGLAREAWERFDPERAPWGVVGRLELALLAGDADLARKLLQQAGALGAPSRTMLALLAGTQPKPEEAARMLAEGRHVHVWRTHASRWQPWIDAARASPALIEVYDLARNVLPDEKALPDVMVDDGFLATLVAPEPQAGRDARDADGIWIDEELCVGVGIGHDWPRGESEKLATVVGERAVTERDGALVWVVGAERALAEAALGRRMVVLAPPGDPFWAGPLPERAWPRMRIVRADAATGWAGFGERVGGLALEAGRTA